MTQNETKKCLRIDVRPILKHHDFLNENRYLGLKCPTLGHSDQSLDSCTALKTAVRLGTGIASIKSMKTKKIKLTKSLKLKDILRIKAEKHKQKYDKNGK